MNDLPAPGLPMFINRIQLANELRYAFRFMFIFLDDPHSVTVNGSFSGGASADSAFVSGLVNAFDITIRFRHASACSSNDEHVGQFIIQQ